MKNRSTHEISELLTDSTSLLSYETTDTVSYETKFIGECDPATMKLFGTLQNGYNYFGKCLFNGRLSPVILVLNRYSKSGTYYLPSAWVDESQIILPEINVLPLFLQAPPVELWASFVHEMVHHFQHTHGNPGRHGYHNKEFAFIMQYLGLMPSSTGMPDGSKTGQHMSQYVIEGGRFDAALKAMPEGCTLPFHSFPTQVHTKNTRYAKTKCTYICRSCHSKAWGKPNLDLWCGKCDLQLVAA